MGGEIGQWREWRHDDSIDWHLAEYERHAGIRRLVADLNRLYRAEPALHVRDCDASGFQWIDADDADHSVLVFLRRGDSESEVVLAVCNFTPMVCAQLPHRRASFLPLARAPEQRLLDLRRRRSGQLRRRRRLSGFESRPALLLGAYDSAPRRHLPEAGRLLSFGSCPAPS